MTLGRPTSKTKELANAKPIIISISGDLGSGKSLLANALVEQWGADRYSTGMVQRRIADRMGITTLELNKRAETDKTIDDQIDSVFKNLAKSPKNLIVDSRMAFHFLPSSFRIKLEVHPKMAATRIKGDTSRIGEGNYTTLDEIEAAIVARKSSERERFKRYYNADIEDHSGYDLVINTTECDPQSISLLANDLVAVWRKGGKSDKLWISPKHTFVNVDPETLDNTVIEKNRITWPASHAWVPGAVTAVRTPTGYIILSGAEWVAAALRSGKGLLPVTLVDGAGVSADPAMAAKWEAEFKFQRTV